MLIPPDGMGSTLDVVAALAQLEDRDGERVPDTADEFGGSVPARVRQD